MKMSVDDSHHIYGDFLNETSFLNKRALYYHQTGISPPGDTVCQVCQSCSLFKQTNGERGRWTWESMSKALKELKFEFMII